MRIRYVGSAEGKDVPLSGGVIQFPRMKWVDPYAEAEAGHIRKEHVDIAVRDLVQQEDWESESHKKAARTRAKNAAEAADNEEQS